MPEGLWIAFGLLWVLVLVQGLTLLEVVRQVADLRGNPGRIQAPKFLKDTVRIGEELPAAPRNMRWASTGKPLEWPDALGGQASALVLLHPGCATCYGVAGDLRRVIRSQMPGTRIVPIVTDRTLERVERFLKDTALPTDATLIDDTGREELAQAINLNRKPAVVLMRGDRIAGAANVFTGDQIADLLRDLLADKVRPDGSGLRDELSPESALV